MAQMSTPDTVIMEIGKAIVDNRWTVRQAGKELGMSKSTIWRHLTVNLPRVSRELSDQVRYVLDYNKSIRHLRGGEATKIKHRKRNIAGL